MPKKAVKKTKAAARPAKKTTKKVVKKSVKRSVKRAGRPKGSGKYGCETKAVRIPANMVDEIQAFILKKLKNAKK